MRAEAVVLLALGGCQWLDGIDPSKSMPVEASVEASPMEAGVDAAVPCDAGGCVQILAEGNPGPFAVAVVSDSVVYGVNTDCYMPPSPVTDVWSMPKTGGDPKRLAADICMSESRALDDQLVIMEPTGIVRLGLDGTEAVLSSTSDNRGGLAIFEGSFYWMIRHDALWKAPIDKSSPASRVIPFGPLQLGSNGLVVDSRGFLWGEDTPHELWSAAPDGSGVKMVASLVGLVGGMDAIGTGVYLTIRTPPVGFWKWDGTSLAPVLSTPPLVTPLRVIAKNGFVYVVDDANYGQSNGAIWRYDPTSDTWLKLRDALSPIIAVDDQYVFWTERVEPGVLYHRRLSRMAR
jgi:hypothetical protein